MASQAHQARKILSKRGWLYGYNTERECSVDTCPTCAEELRKAIEARTESIFEGLDDTETY